MAAAPPEVRPEPEVEPEPYVRIEGATKKIGEFTADADVSLEIYRGEVLRVSARRFRLR